MRRLVNTLTIVMLLAGFVFPSLDNPAKAALDNHPAYAPPLARWTFMFYGAGDNNLEQCISANVEQMEQVGSSADLNIVAQVDDDANHNYQACNGYGTDGAYRARIIKHKTPGPAHVRDSANPILNPDYEALATDPNMGASNTLSDFIRWAVGKYPARNYALVINDHGAGWRGLAHDVSSEDGVGEPGDWMDMDELFDALSNGGVHLRAIAFDACLMAELEVARQVEAFADVMVASQDCIPGTGYPYDSMLAALRAHLNWDGADLGSDMVDRYAAYYAGNPDFTLSAVRLAGRELDSLTGAVSTLGTQLRGDDNHHGVDDYHDHLHPFNNVQIGIRSARAATHEPGMHCCGTSNDPDDASVDLRDLTDKLNGEIRIDGGYKAAIPAVQQYLKAVVIKERHGPSHDNGTHGLSLYFPEAEAQVSASTVITYDGGSKVGTLYAPNPGWDRDDSRPDPYEHPLRAQRGFIFPRVTKWDEFLYRYYEPVADAGPDKATVVGGTVILDASGSSDSDGHVTRYIWDYLPAINTDDDDYDRDGNTNPGPETDDDQSAVGVQVPFTCAAPGVYRVRLMVRDDHEDFYPPPNQHFNVDDDFVSVNCSPLPVGTSTPSATMVPQTPTPISTATATATPSGTATVQSTAMSTATRTPAPTGTATAISTGTATPTRMATP